MSQINVSFEIVEKNTGGHLYEIEQKLRYLGDSFRRNNLRTESVEEEEADDEN